MSLISIYRDPINWTTTGIDVNTSSRSRMFQTVTMSLCIAYEAFFRLTLNKYKPDTIPLQYSVNCHKQTKCRQQAAEPMYSFSLLYDNSTSGQYSAPGNGAYLTEAAILPSISTRCAIAKAICGASELFRPVGYYSQQACWINRSYRAHVHSMDSKPRHANFALSCRPTVAMYQDSWLGPDVNAGEAIRDANVPDTKVYGIWFGPSIFLVDVGNCWPYFSWKCFSAASWL